MNALLLRRFAFASLIGIAVMLSSSCAVGVGGYGDGYGSGYDGSVGIGVDYYAPFGVDYGGWGPGYRVGPFRGGDHRHERTGGRTPTRGFRPAPVGRAMPSIPQRSPGGGRRSR